MNRHWILQGNPAKWDYPARLYSEPIHGWSVKGIETSVAVGDGVLIWMANSQARLRGIYAAGTVVGEATTDYPDEWGDAKQRTTLTPFVPLAVQWYLIHNPVSVDELRLSALRDHEILRMSRKTAYPVTAQQFTAVIDLMQEHGPTALPVKAAREFGASIYE